MEYIYRSYPANFSKQKVLEELQKQRPSMLLIPGTFKREWVLGKIGEIGKTDALYSVGFVDGSTPIDPATVGIQSNEEWAIWYGSLSLADQITAAPRGIRY